MSRIMSTLIMPLIFTLFTFVYGPDANAAPGAHGPDGEHLSEEAPLHNTGIGRQADGSVLMPMATQRQLGILTQMTQSATASRYIPLEAIVRSHPSGRAVVQPSSNGRFDAAATGVPVTGQHVKAGEVLGYIHYQDTAYELASQSSELISLRSEAEQIIRDIDRLKALGDLTPKQQLEQLQTQLKRLQQQEKLLQQSLEKPEVLLAPISGIIHNNSLSRGQWVEAGDTLFEIINPSHLMVEATTTDTQLLTMLDTAVPENAPEVKLQFIGHAAKLQNGLISVFFQPVATNKPASVPLILGQPIQIRAKLKQQMQGIVLPAQAIVRNSANLPIVWIKLSAERFLPQQVQYSVLDPEQVLITQGLGADNRAVVQGTSLLNQVR